MKKILTITGIILVVAVGLWLLPDVDTVDNEDSEKDLQTYQNEEYGFSIKLPENYHVSPTNNPYVSTVENKIKSRNTAPYALVEFEGHYYHNDQAERLSDYTTTYEGKDIDVIIESNQYKVIDRIDVLMQKYSAGDIENNGEVSYSSLASLQNMYRYVIPRGDSFVIISSKDKAFLEKLVRNLDLE